MYNKQKAKLGYVRLTCLSFDYFNDLSGDMQDLMSSFMFGGAVQHREM